MAIIFLKHTNRTPWKHQGELKNYGHKKRLKRGGITNIFNKIMKKKKLPKAWESEAHTGTRDLQNIYLFSGCQQASGKGTASAVVRWPWDQSHKMTRISKRDSFLDPVNGNHAVISFISCSVMSFLHPTSALAHQALVLLPEESSQSPLSSSTSSLWDDTLPFQKKP